MLGVPASMRNSATTSASASLPSALHALATSVGGGGEKEGRGKTGRAGARASTLLPASSSSSSSSRPRFAARSALMGSLLANRGNTGGARENRDSGQKDRGTSQGSPATIPWIPLVPGLSASPPTEKNLVRTREHGKNVCNRSATRQHDADALLRGREPRGAEFALSSRWDRVGQRLAWSVGRAALRACKERAARRRREVVSPPLSPLTDASDSPNNPPRTLSPLPLLAAGQ